MMTLAQLRALPKEMLIELLKTAQTILYDDLVALQAIREERRVEWADYCDPTLATREQELVSKMNRGSEWLNLVQAALGDTRPALVRLLVKLSDEEHFPLPNSPNVDGGGVPSAALDAMGEVLGDT
jgi:hypothetical protein